MKHLKTFENFDLGRFSENGEEENEWMNDVEEAEQEDMFSGFDDDDDTDDDMYDNVDEEGDDIESRRRIWGDELVEGLTDKQKKLPKALQDAILKKKEKGSSKKDKKSNKKEDNSKKGLTDKQKKLPKALQDAILKNQKQK